MKFAPVLLPVLMLTFLVLNGQPCRGQTGPLHPQLAITNHTDKPQFQYILAWDSTSMVWDSSSQYTYSYTPDGKIHVQEYSEYDPGGFYVPYSRLEYNYGTGGYDETLIISYWLNNQWDTASRQTTKYYPTNTSLWTSVWYATWQYNNSMWDSVSGSRSYRVLNPQGMETNVRNYFRSFNAPGYEPTTMIETHYNAQMQEDTIIWFHYSNGWVPERRNIQSQWVGSNPTFILSQANRQGSWADSARQSFTYGVHGSYTLISEQLSTSVWLNDTKIEVFNDTMGHKTSSWFYDWMGGNWYLTMKDSSAYQYDSQGQTTQITYYDHSSNLGPFYQAYRSIFTDFFVSNGNAAHPAPEVKIYPVPSSGSIFCQMESAIHGPVLVRVYDLQGNLRLSSAAHFSGQVLQFPVGDMLGSGTYILVLLTREGEVRKRIQVLH